MNKPFAITYNYAVWFTLLCLNVTLLSCSIIIDEIGDRIEENANDDIDELQAAIKNNTPYIIERAEIKTDKIIQVYGPIQPNSVSQYKTFNSLFNEEAILIKTKDEVFKFTPKQQDNTTKVNAGSFYFEVSLSEKRTLIINRKPY